MQGITARREHLAALVAASAGIVTALSPLLGYETACAIAVEVHRTGRPALELVRERTAIEEDVLLDLTSAAALTGRPRPDDHARTTAI